MIIRSLLNGPFPHRIGELAMRQREETQDV